MCNYAARGGLGWLLWVIHVLTCQVAGSASFYLSPVHNVQYIKEWSLIYGHKMVTVNTLPWIWFCLCVHFLLYQIKKLLLLMSCKMWPKQKQKAGWNQNRVDPCYSWPTLRQKLTFIGMSFIFLLVLRLCQQDLHVCWSSPIRAWTLTSVGQVMRCKHTTQYTRIG